MVILFDFGGTLDGDGDGWAERFHRAYATIGGGLSLCAFAPHFRESEAAFARLPAASCMGLRQMIEVQAALVTERLRDRLDPRAMAHRVYLATLSVVERNRPYLEALARRHRLGIVTYFPGNLARCLTELDLAPLFALTCYSALSGGRASQPRLLQTALAALDGRPRESWMVGDDFDADVLPAAALGMCTCWLAPPDRIPPVDSVATVRAARLPQACAMFR